MNGRMAVFTGVISAGVAIAVAPATLTIGTVLGSVLVGSALVAAVMDSNNSDNE